MSLINDNVVGCPIHQTQDLTVNIVHQNPEFWVLEKPASMSFHAESASCGLIEFLYQQYPNQTFFPVHRLDKLTSGLVLVALTAAVAAELGGLFERHLVQKTYVALADRKPKKKQGMIKGGMQFSRRGQWKLTHTTENLAITRFESISINQGKRLYFLYPQTGKTHQLRVALKSLGSPILGDERYGGTPADRGYLHAYQLEFTWRERQLKWTSLPWDGECFTADVLRLIEAQSKTRTLFMHAK